MTVGEPRERKKVRVNSQVDDIQSSMGANDGRVGVSSYGNPFDQLAELELVVKSHQI